MLRNKSDIRFKLIVITLVLLSCGMLFASLFVSNQKHTNDLNVSNTTIENDVEKVQDGFMSFKWNKDGQNKIIQPLTITGNTNSSSGSYYITYDGISSTTVIQGGTTITPSKVENSNDCVLTLTGSTSGKITLNFQEGYTFQRISFGYKDGNQHVEVKSWAGEANFSTTSEEMDPDYTGELSFKIITGYYNYQFNKYYANSGLTNGDLFSSDRGTYNIGGYTDIDDLSFLFLPNNACEFKGWIFNVYNAQETQTMENGYIVELTQDSGAKVIKVTKDGSSLEVFFKYNEDESDTDNGLYVITEVKGKGLFKQDPENDSLSIPSGSKMMDPIIYAWFVNKYDVKFGIGYNYWDDIGADYKVDLRGVYFSADGKVESEVGGTSTQFAIANNDQYDYTFIDQEMEYANHDFFKQRQYVDFASKPSSQSVINKPYYFVFNYGHCINGYLIELNWSDGNKKHAYYDQENGVWEIVTVENIEKTAIGCERMSSLAACLDELYFGEYNLPTIHITPVWGGVELRVEQNDETKSSVNLAFGNYYCDYHRDNCNVNHSSQGYTYHLNIYSEHFGQTILYYTVNGSENDVIARSGVWNYIEYDSSMYEWNEGQVQYGEEYYVVKVEPQFVNNIHKIKLSDVVKFGDDYKLDEGCEYEFNLTSGVYADEYSYLTYGDYNGFWENLPQFIYGDKDGNDYVLIDRYISTVLAYKTSWQSVLSNSDIFNKVYYNSQTATLSNSVTLKTSQDSMDMFIYLPNNYEKELPVFLNEYRNLIFWKNGALNLDEEQIVYKTPHFENEFSGEITSNGFIDSLYWSVSHGNTTISPYYVYRIDLLYETKNGSYGKLKSNWFGLNSTNSIGGNDINNVPTSSRPWVGAQFGGWVFNAANASNLGYWDYSVKSYVDGVDGVVNFISFDAEFELSMDVKRNVYNENLYYIININGKGVLKQETSTENPIITAKWSKLYEMEILSNSKWSDYGDLTADQKNSLRGAYASLGNGAVENGGSSVILQIAHNDGYKYKFMSSEINTASALSFWKKTDWNNDKTNAVFVQGVDINQSPYYYVYNYGYYITGWKLQVVNNVSFVKDSNGWKLATLENDIISIEDLSGENFSTLAEFAEQADEYFAAEKGTKNSLKLIPEWTAVNINVKHDNNTQDTNVDDVNITSTRFDERYATSFVTSPNGKSLFSYKVGDEYIASTLNSDGQSGVWNYTTIIKDRYTYENTTEEIGGGTYSLYVTPVFIDNIYKINLIDVKVSDEEGYKLSPECEYVFSETIGSYDAADAVELTFENSYGVDAFEDYVFIPYSSSFVLMDSYIVTLKRLQEIFEDGIDGNGLKDFDIFRKVYYNTGVIVNDVLTKGSTETEFNIYLANAQKTGEMPVFAKDYYSLIFWKNKYSHLDCGDCGVEDLCVNYGNEYAYITHNYEDDLHTNELNGFACRIADVEGIKKSSTYQDVWYYTDGFGADGLSFETHYFRRYYELDVQTLFEDELARKGYVHIDIVDRVFELDDTVDDMGGEFVVIAQTNQTGVLEMVVYQAVRDYWVEDYVTLTSDFLNSAENNILEKVGYLNSDKKYKFKLYEGCDITFNIMDQSRDSFAMNSGNFDEMIGYKYSMDNGILQDLKKINGGTVGDDENKTLFEDYIVSPYVYFADAAQVAGRGFDCGDTIVIQVPFEKISYDMTVLMDNNKAGEFDVKENADTYRKNLHTLKDIQVGNFYQITYLAFAGYTLQSSAFVVNDLELQSYVDGDSQTYTITGNFNGESYFDGTWLRKFFYSYNPDYSIEAVSIPSLVIKTDVIKFNLGFKFEELRYESTSYRTYEMKTVNGSQNFALNWVSGIGSTPSFNSYFTNEGERTYYYEFDGKKFMLHSSRMFKPHDSASESGNFHTTYSFLLTSEPTNTFNVDSSVLANMVTNYENGMIIPVDDRDIYILLQFKQILNVALQVQVSEHDTNSTTREIVVANTVYDYFEKATISSNAKAIKDYYETTNGTVVVNAYAVRGVANSLNANYDKNRYSSVEYYFNKGDSLTKISQSSVVLESDSKIVAKFVPKALDIDVEYYLNGQRTYDVEELITDNASQLGGPIYINQSFTYSVSSLNVDYNYRVAINNHITSAEEELDNENNFVAHHYEYTVGDSDYGYGDTIIVTVDLELKVSGEINLRYQMVDSLKKKPDDDYGTFSVYENEILKTQNVKEAYVNAVIDRNIYVELNLPVGYKYVGIKHGTKPAEYPEIDENKKVLLIDQFDPNTDDGNYLILIDKIDVSAFLSTAGLKAKYFINGKTDLTKLYVGDTIEFTHEDVDAERLGCFFYSYGVGENATTVYLTEDGTETGVPLTSIKITSELLSEIGSTVIKFGVVVVNRYKFELQVEGLEYLKSGSMKVMNLTDNEEYVLGTYCDEGTEISISAETIVEGKYTIQFNDSSYDKLELGDEVITLVEDVKMTLTIQPNVYNVIVDENVYSSLTQVKELAPEDEFENQVNGIIESSKTQTYNNVATIEFNRLKQGDRQLSALYISGNDSEDVIMIEFNGASYTAYIIKAEDIDEENINKSIKTEIALETYGVNIQVTTNAKIRLTYVPVNSITLRLDYKLYKVIDV